MVENETVCALANKAPDSGLTQTVTGSTAGWDSTLL